MTSPFVRRRRLAAELRALREHRGMTAGRLSQLIHQSRMKVSRLENAHIRPDLAEIIKILDVLDVTGDKWNQIVRIACDAAEKGWWDAYGDAMGPRQRLYADIESGAKTIREYHPSGMPGILQTPEFTWAMIELAKAESQVPFVPERLVAARLERRRAVLRTDGPVYEAVIDELALRRYAVPPEVMRAQLRHLIATTEQEPRVSIRVLPLQPGPSGSLPPQSPFYLFTFPDPTDPPMAVVETVAADLVHTESAEVSRYVRRYEHVLKAALTEDESRTLLADAADPTGSP
ncbi:helix-turn-helix transcriptional regulator [Actinomadura barringtoniae]|uniref:Helix-turn-helix transcriptional regulator n=1 Tax=Actinomadura barringtoniae TaxID=1427535 RepID=A0A939TG23_9ACTN|nr:helix-turn-helix transcriptional regulator [Actinomadura barringtoniae]MBO2454990.1 helix-turn-helix transcriptional regulator [Actinomadura barringtoniae]